MVKEIKQRNVMTMKKRQRKNQCRIHREVPLFLVS